MSFYKTAIQQIIETSLKSASETKQNAGALVYDNNQPSPTGMTVGITDVTNIEQFLASILPEVSVARSSLYKNEFFNRALSYAESEINRMDGETERVIHITFTENPSSELNNKILKLKEKKAIVFVTSVGSSMRKEQLEDVLSNADYVVAVNRPEDLQDVKDKITDYKAKSI